jgi:hypothetical protein
MTRLRPALFAKALIATLLLAACGESQPVPPAKSALPPMEQIPLAQAPIVGTPPADAPGAEPRPPPSDTVAIDPMDAELSSERAMQLNLPVAGGPVWDLLRTTRIGLNQQTMLYTAAHPPAVRAMAGKSVTLRGYMLPLEANERTAHFLISPYTPICFFHPPAEPNEVIEIRTRKPIAAGYHLVEVTGVLSLANDGEKGLFFRIDNAKAKVVGKAFSF